VSRPRPLETRAGQAWLYAGFLAFGAWEALFDDKAAWLVFTILLVVATETLETKASHLSPELRARYGWVGLGALLFAPFVLLGSNLFTGPEFTSWRAIVAIVAAAARAIAGPLVGGDVWMSLVVCCWGVAYLIWRLRGAATPKPTQ
jgi:hypothetical protein